MTPPGMIGNRLGYPIYVLQAGAFLAGALVLFIKNAFLGGVCIVTMFFGGCFDCKNIFL